MPPLDALAVGFVAIVALLTEAFAYRIWGPEESAELETPRPRVIGPGPKPR